MWEDPKKEKDPVNWLSADNMLKAVIPKSRIMTFKYESKWLGRDSVFQQRLSSIGVQLLESLKCVRKKEVCEKSSTKCHGP